MLTKCYSHWEGRRKDVIEKLSQEELVDNRQLAESGYWTKATLNSGYIVEWRFIIEQKIIQGKEFDIGKSQMA
jgi:hypothetical protein